MKLALGLISKNILKISNNSSSLRSIMTTSIKLEKALEDLEKNPYFDKYADKIASLQKTSPEEFLSRIDAQAKKIEKKKPVADRQYSALLQPKKPLSVENNAVSKGLDSIMKLDLISDKEAVEIKEIWLKYHLQQEVIAATIPAEEFIKMSEQAKLTPTFLFPLPRSQGYEFIMTQFQGNEIHFTPLICFQVHKENAPECLTITNYTEFLESKGIVLMRGEFDKNVIDAKEAQCLANQLQLFYNQKDPEKLRLMNLFNTKPEEFKHMDLIKQIELIKIE